MLFLCFFLLLLHALQCLFTVAWSESQFQNKIDQILKTILSLTYQNWDNTKLLIIMICLPADASFTFYLVP